MDPVLSQLARLSLALLFASAAWHKLGDLRRFEAVLADYQLLPASVVPAVAVGFATFEVALALALLVPAAAGLAALAAIALLASYSTAIAVNLARGRREIDCGCGLDAGRTLRPALLVRNAALALLAVVAALPVAGRTVSWLDGVTLAAGVATLALAWQASGRLAALPALPRAQLERAPAHSRSKRRTTR